MKWTPLAALDDSVESGWRGGAWWLTDVLGGGDQWRAAGDDTTTTISTPVLPLAY